MSDREQQIREIRDVITARCTPHCKVEITCHQCEAEALYDAGYRKPTESWAEYNQRIAAQTKRKIGG